MGRRQCNRKRGGTHTFTIDRPDQHQAASATATARHMRPLGWTFARMAGSAPAFILAVIALTSPTVSSSASEQVAPDWSRYQPGTIASLIARYPAQAQNTLALSPDMPFRMRVRYASEFRELPQDARRLLTAWGTAMSVSGLLQTFRREVKVSEAGAEYWLPVQEHLLHDISVELHRDEEFEVYVIYIGNVDGRHILLINAFDHAHHEKPQTMTTPVRLWARWMTSPTKLDPVPGKEASQ